jgi:ubiquinone biosynthesis UbiH/UbiF/VisC/COQ6 family hydroxylase
LDYDLVVVGGGPVGASLVRAVRGLTAALVAQEQRVAGAPPGPSFDPRVYALSPGNVAFLRDIGVWQRVPGERVTPVHAMQVFGDDPSARLEFDAYAAGVAELAWIVEDSALQDALRADLDAVAPAHCETLEVDPERAVLGLADGRRLRARLIVGADGASSFVRAQAGIDVVEKTYGQAALVANFEAATGHANIAYQWFQGGGVLALLPLPGRLVSMVWSLPEGEAARVAALPAQALCEEAERAARGRLGALALASPVRSLPLRRLSARRTTAARIALLGDAAHVIHPLAGQGLNLGLQDARVLAEVLAGREPIRDPGDARLLRRYERARAGPILAMDATVDALFRLFGARNRGVAVLRNSGLNLVDRVPVLKNILIRQAMS